MVKKSRENTLKLDSRDLKPLEKPIKYVQRFVNKGEGPNYDVLTKLKRQIEGGNRPQSFDMYNLNGVFGLSQEVK